MTQWTYFAADGSYGDAKDLVLVNTTDWNDYEWDSVSYAADTDHLPTLAEKVALDTNAFVIYGDEVAVETKCERCLYITDDEVVRSYWAGDPTVANAEGVL
jgi:hypothetical protein